MKRIILLCLSLFLVSGCVNVGVLPMPLYHNDTTIVTEKYSYAVGSGELNSATIWNKWGYNTDVDTGSEEVVSHFGGTNSFILSSAEILNISSTNVNDVLGGTGANYVLITGVNNTFHAIEELIPLNGTNIVQTTKEFRGVNRMVVYLGGTNFKNDGNITAFSAITNLPQAQIPAGDGTTQQAFLFTQADNTFLANYLRINVNKLAGGGAPKITIRGWVRSYVSNSEYEVFRETYDTEVENLIELIPQMPFIVGEKSIIYFTAETDTNNAIVSVRFSGIEKH